MNSEVVHDPAQNRYQLVIDGTSVGEIDYVLREGSIVFTHTEVDPNRREGGLGGALARGALDLVRAETDYRVVADCAFIAKWIESHPDYQDLLTR